MVALVHLVGCQVYVSILLFGWIGLVSEPLPDFVSCFPHEPCVSRNSPFIPLIKCSFYLVLMQFYVCYYFFVLGQLGLEAAVASHFVLAEFHWRVWV